MVNKDRVALLVEALESGEYEQGHYRLQRNGKFCCLGVACEVAIAHGLAVERTEIVTELTEFDGAGLGKKVTQTDVDYDNESSFLPVSVAEWFGFGDTYDTDEFRRGRKANPALRINGEVTCATEANDYDGYNLSEIAGGFRAMYLTDAE